MKTKLSQIFFAAFAARGCPGDDGAKAVGVIIAGDRGAEVPDPGRRVFAMRSVVQGTGLIALCGRAAAPSALLLPPHLVRMEGAVEPLHFYLAAVCNLEALAGNQLTNDVRDQDLPALRLRRQP